MTLVFVLVAFALGMLVLLVYLAFGHGRRARIASQELASQTRRVDLEAFRNLLDEAEEEFLRANLPREEFRVIQRERLRAAAEYVGCVSHNASILLRLSEVAKGSPDPEIARAGKELSEQALHLRLLALLTLGKLYVAIALPARQISIGMLVHHYQQLSDLATWVARMQNPSRGAQFAGRL